jgi:predicted DNA-binding transcriptional regulator YafY
MNNQKSALRVMRIISLISTSPRSVQYLSNLFEISERSVYRYFDLLYEIGFEVKKNEYNRFYIDTEKPNNLSFTPEEGDFLRNLILSAANDHTLTDALLMKIQQNCEVNIVTTNSYRIQLSAHVRKIAEAIEQGLQIKLRNYTSLNSMTTTDRTVEPIQFTENYKNLIAFEIESQQNKLFNIARIERIDVLKTKMRNKKKHQSNETDLFGFAPNQDKKRYFINLKMTIKAFSLLTEEFPNTITHITKNEKENTFTLSCTLNSLTPINRFVNGLPDDTILTIQE